MNFSLIWKVDDAAKKVEVIANRTYLLETHSAISYHLHHRPVVVAQISLITIQREPHHYLAQVIRSSARSHILEKLLKVKSPIGNLSPAIELQTKNKPVSSVQSGPMKSMFGSFELDETILGGDDPMEVHFLTEALNMSRIDIIESLPREMQQQFFECGWVLDRKKQLHCPILVLSPFSIKDGNITSEWLRKYRASVENMDKMPYLV